MPAPASPALGHCRNCGHPRVDRFCGRCGQDSRDHTHEIKELLRDFAEHVAAFDLKSARSLWTLIAKPGLLTLDWSEGRRARWVSPFRLYLAASFLFYVALWTSGLALLQLRAYPMTPEEMRAAHMAPHPDGTPTYEIAPDLLVPPAPPVELPPLTRQRLQDRADEAGLSTLARAFQRALANQPQLNQAADVWMPRILFALVPLAACLFALFRSRRPLLLLDHLSFALHLQSFIFLLSVVMMPIWYRTEAPVASIIPGLIILAYGTLAHRRVYGNALWLSGLKVLVVLAIYLTLLILSLFVIAVIDLSYAPG